MPIVRKQGNAFLAAPRVEGERFHYFDTGIKRLIIELELDDVCIFLVHLALKYRQRQYQLRYLHDLIAKSHKPVIVTGDFNTFWGTHEIYLFMRAAGLRSANEKNLPSFPARIPRIELDFVLVSKEIEITHFEVPDVRWSDHRPVLCDFNVRGAVASRTCRRVDFAAMTSTRSACLARRDRCRRHRLAQLRQAGHLHQRAVARRRWSELDRISRRCEQSPPRGLVIRSAKASGFIAGADVQGIRRNSKAPRRPFELVRAAQRILDRLEALPCPTVAIIHGFALGGGFELALACRYRVGVKSEKFSIGLPEVMLGIHPGFGGTVRAVRRAGVRTAMEMMLTGKTLRADKAKRAGFIDRLVFPADAEAAARELISRQPKQRQPRLLDRVLSWPLVRSLVQQAAHRAGARQGAPGTLPGALRHHRSVDEVRRARRSAPTRPKRARSPTSWSARPRATWCACSCCRIGSRTSAARASCRSSASTWSARA